MMPKPIDKNYLIKSLKSFDEQILGKEYLKKEDVSKQDTHKNKEILDKFSESLEGKLLYNGKEIEGSANFEFTEYTNEEIESAVKQILRLS